jgi:hypothetical protein
MKMAKNGVLILARHANVYSEILSVIQKNVLTLYVKHKNMYH